MLQRSELVIAGVLVACLLASSCGPAAQPAAGERGAAGSAPTAGAAGQQPGGDSRGRQLLDELVARAKQEGALDTTLTTNAAEAVPRLRSAFLARFGLNIDVRIDSAGNEPGKVSQVLSAHQTGVPPLFDTLQADAIEHLNLLERGLPLLVENWEALLPEVNPLVSSEQAKPTDVSPSPFSGYSFLWATRDNSLYYNTNLVRDADLPRTFADLAAPKYKGMFPVHPWVDYWLLGILVYPKDQWLQTLEQIGKNAVGVDRPVAIRARVALGELPMAPETLETALTVLKEDPQAPIGHRFFSDYTPLKQVLYFVPRGARHPAAGTLWALWMTTPEAQAIWQEYYLTFQLPFGQSDLDKKFRRTLEESGTKTLTWLDSPETLAQLQWLATPDGQAYQKEVVRVVTQRQ